MRWGKIFKTLGDKSGNTFATCEIARDAIEEAGFSNVKELRLKLPIGTWAKDIKLKNWGAWNRMFLLQSLEGWTIRGMTSLLGVSHPGRVETWTGHHADKPRAL